MKAILLLIALIAVVSAIPTYTGWQFLGKGFNVVKGFTRPFTPDEAATSFGLSNVWVADDNEDITQSPLVTFASSQRSRSITSMSELTREVQTDVRVGANFTDDLAFQGSASWNRVRQQFSAGVTEVFSLNASETRMQLVLDLGRQGRLFSRRAAALPADFNAGTQEQFYSFIETFGTHFIKSVVLGGRYMFSSFLTANRTSELNRRGFNANAALTYAQAYAAGINTTRNQPVLTALNQSDISIDIQGYGGNGNLIRASDFVGWSNDLTTSTLIMPVTFTLSHYINLIPPTSQNAMRAALEQYHLDSLTDRPAGQTDLDIKTRTNQRYYAFTPARIDLNRCAENPEASGCTTLDLTNTPEDVSSAATVAPLVVAIVLALCMLLL